MPSPSTTVLTDRLSRRVQVSCTLQDIHGELASVLVALDYVQPPSVAGEGILETYELAAATLVAAIGAASNATVVSWSLTIAHDVPVDDRVSPSAAEYATTSNVLNIRLSNPGTTSLSPFDITFSVPAPVQALLGPTGTEDAITVTASGAFGTAAAETLRAAVNAWITQWTSPGASLVNAIAARGTIGSRKAKFGRRPRLATTLPA